MESSDYVHWKADVGEFVKSKAKFYPDFPKKGVNFMDLFSLTSDPEVFKKLNADTVRIIETEVGKSGEAFNCIVGLESRGFIQGPFLAQHFGIPFVPIRKKGKLPGECYQQAYGTEYS